MKPIDVRVAYDAHSRISESRGNTSVEDPSSIAAVFFGSPVLIPTPLEELRHRGLAAGLAALGHRVAARCHRGEVAARQLARLGDRQDVGTAELRPAHDAGLRPKVQVKGLGPANGPNVQPLHLVVPHRVAG